MRRLRPLTLTLAAAVLGLVGCGGTSGDGGADPATAMPAGTAVYLEFVVRPEGDLKKQMEGFAGKVLRTDDPGRKIVELLESLDDDGGGSYEQDVEPWLGRRAGAALMDFQGDELAFVIAVASKDADAAGETIARAAERGKEKRGSYKDHELWVDGDGAATAAVGDFVMLASSEAQLRRAIDAQAGSSLGDSDRYKAAIEPLADDRAGAIYLDSQRLLGEIAKSGDLGASEQQIFRQFFGSGDLPPTALAVIVEESLLALDSRSNLKDYTGIARTLSGLGYFGATDLVGEVPGDAWLSAGVPKLGETAKEIVNSFAGALGGAVLGGQLEQQLGIDLDRDVYSWIGDVAIFARGKTLPELDGALVIDVLDAARARAALPRLIGALQQQGGPRARPVAVGDAQLAFALEDPSLPQPIVVALAGERAAIAYGMDAAEAALKPPSKLAGSDLWDRAAGTLDGLDPSFVLDGATVVGLVTTVAKDDPDVAKARLHLEAIDVLASGMRKEGDEVRSRFSVGLK